MQDVRFRINFKIKDEGYIGRCWTRWGGFKRSKPKSINKCQ